MKFHTLSQSGSQISVSATEAPSHPQRLLSLPIRLAPVLSREESPRCGTTALWLLWKPSAVVLIWKMAAWTLLWAVGRSCCMTCSFTCLFSEVSWEDPKIIKYVTSEADDGGLETVSDAKPRRSRLAIPVYTADRIKQSEIQVDIYIYTVLLITTQDRGKKQQGRKMKGALIQIILLGMWKKKIISTLIKDGEIFCNRAMIIWEKSLIVSDKLKKMR